MTNRNFLDFYFPNLYVNTESYNKFNSDPVVLNIKKDVDTISQSNQLFKEDLIYLLSLYPKNWVQSYIGVGRIKITNAGRREEYFGAGLPLLPAGVGSRYIYINTRYAPI